MILFHSSIKSNRLNYVLNYLFIERLGIEYKFIDDLNLPQNALPIVNYSQNFIENAWNIVPNGLLSRLNIEKQSHSFLRDENSSFQFPSDNFDCFSAIFYHLSRYEEYLSIDLDMHARFKHQNSVLHQKGVLKTPVIDVWVLEIKKILIQMGVETTKFKVEKFCTQASIDIDSVFSYKGRTVGRQLAATLKSLATFNIEEIRKRWGVMVLNQQDPNDNFDYQMHALGGKTCHYFIQVGKYGKYDKNVAPSNKAFQSRIEQLKQNGHIIGLHPSYQSFNQSSIFEHEKSILENIIQAEITVSRQHYLRFRLPETFRTLLKCNIKEDHSMGYSEVPGFRAGTAHPFKWFDLDKNEVSDLKLVPFSCMDVAFKQFLKYNYERTISEIKAMKSVLKELNSPFVFVFHNESLSGHRGWENWDKVFENWLNEND